MKRFELEEIERKVLAVLAEKGATTPSQVAAETWTLPGDILVVLKSLSVAGFVVMRGDANSADGMVVAITQEARDYINGEQR
jgi:DNA-binding MarR family transcriptional regulator